MTEKAILTPGELVTKYYEITENGQYILPGTTIMVDIKVDTSGERQSQPDTKGSGEYRLRDGLIQALAEVDKRLSIYIGNVGKKPKRKHSKGVILGLEIASESIEGLLKTGNDDQGG